jgi:hypothetical protein
MVLKNHTCFPENEQHEDLVASIRLYNIYILVDGFKPSEKYELVGMILPNVWKNNTCSKPPTIYIVDPITWESNQPFSLKS